VTADSCFSFRFAASFTVEPIQQAVEFWAGYLGSQFQCEFAPFGQILQSILDPASLFASNNHGVNIVVFRWQDLGEPSRRLENAQALMAAIEGRLSNFSVPLLVVPDVDHEDWWKDVPGAYLLSPSQVESWYPVSHKHSAEGERLGGIPYTEDYFIALAASIVRVAHSLHKSPHKVVVLDCDNTLWKGICGEDGPEAVQLSTGYEAIQRFALRQKQQGMLLTLASKNNEADVRETFAKHPEFPLHWSDITAARINWQSKSRNLAELAAELSLSLDSFVFFDDNARETSEVREQLPQVVSLTLPEETDHLGRWLNHIWAFDQAKTTQADADRAASYAGVKEFGQALHKAGSLEEFYDSLELKLEIRSVTSAELDRAAQLTQRTNQFNFTTIRRTAAELQKLREAGLDIFGVHVSDRFGNYGFTGLLMGRRWANQYLTDTFLLSCRVLGRGVEHQVFCWLGNYAKSLGCEFVQIPFHATAKNAPAQQFAAQFESRVSVDVLTALRFQPQASVAVATSPVTQTQARHSVDYGLIADHLNSVEKIRERLHQHRPLVLETNTESRLASIWQEILNTDDISGESNFFDLGGHSLKVVMLLIRIEESFAVSLGIEDVYASEVNLERMARRIDELKTFGGVNHQEYTRILGAIEAMTEEEAESAWREESLANADSFSR
jgi:FkbH-like protein